MRPPDEIVPRATEPRTQAPIFTNCGLTESHSGSVSMRSGVAQTGGTPLATVTSILPLRWSAYDGRGGPKCVYLIRTVTARLRSPVIVFAEAAALEALPPPEGGMRVRLPSWPVTRSSSFHVPTLKSTW